MTEEEQTSPSEIKKDPVSEEKTSRMDTAKAFFRAMYTGEESEQNMPEQTSQTNKTMLSDQRIKELEQIISDLEQKVSTAEGLYHRMAADFDNFRRRTQREKEEYLNIGLQRTAEALLPSLDDLERALLYLKKDTPPEKIIESFQLVSSGIVSCLEKIGLKRLDTKGAIFDPRFHEPVQQIETNEYPDGTVMTELRGGYIIGEKVVRPALVNVASNSTSSLQSLDNADRDSDLPDDLISNRSANSTNKKMESDEKIYDLDDY